MLKTICSTFPFMVCLCWFVTFVLHSKRNDPAKRVMTVFLATCAILYLCHAVYFNGGLPVWAESLWGLCSLSVYPLYYIYICRLTCHPLGVGSMALWLAPGVLVALAMLLFPYSEADTVRKWLNAAQIITILYLGYKRLQTFDKNVANVYAETEGRDTSAERVLLIAFVMTSLLSASANVLGKQYVASSDVWGILMAIAFTILLYALSYMAYTRSFPQEQYLKDISCDEDCVELGHVGTVDECELGRNIEELMARDYYLVKNLKITDLAREVKSCRTYVSNYINKTYHCSFSDYINQMRVQYAQHLLQSGNEPTQGSATLHEPVSQAMRGKIKGVNIKMTVVADMSGFSSEHSFYRNFKKFVGKTPIDWLESL